MKEKLTEIFSPLAQKSYSNQVPKLMTHIVAGYPSFEINLQCINAMKENGADLVEVQLPFSDPMADGPTIMKANQKALDFNISLEDIFAFLKELTASTSLPILIMTYYNLPYRMGLEKFFQKTEALNICGLIIPDILFDNINENYLERIKFFDLHPILVTSPGISNQRLKLIALHASGLLYTTLRTGITGVKKKIDLASTEYLKRLKDNVKVPIAAGFGISSPEQIDQLKDKVEVVVIGSKIIKFFEDYPAQEAIIKMNQFLHSCKN